MQDSPRALPFPYVRAEGATLSQLPLAMLPKRRGRLTLDAWLDEWLAQVQISCRASTLEAYARHAKKLRPQLGRVLLVDLAPATIRQALAAQADWVSATELHHMHGTLSTALAAAVKEGHILKSPLPAVARPRRSDFEARTLTEAQARRLID